MALISRTYPLLLIGAALSLGGCAQVSGLFGGQSAPAVEPAPAAASAAAPDATQPPETRRPPQTAVTAEDFDTTTEAERQAAAAPPSAADADVLVGTATVSLGSPTEPGFWLETPLVDAVTPGRVQLSGGGASAQVELRPAAPGTGSRLSLAAMRLLGVAVTDLPQVDIFRVSGGA
ncbi:hypothetical protein SAMN05421759_102467 [Roseivivax lentus]|uniref:D-galactarate dehydratase n=1 Tax=Roseivivax lentus TaxID=633194 RepID=A0A1N7L8A5_9RHOB|nr:hypothetical protein [Roseivivax lentus]SIS70056.1 hypothetical protein SAMN05421759_102467 [Roseivivax lentus]